MVTFQKTGWEQLIELYIIIITRECISVVCVRNVNQVSIINSTKDFMEL